MDETVAYARCPRWDISLRHPLPVPAPMAAALYQSCSSFDLAAILPRHSTAGTVISFPSTQELAGAVRRHISLRVKHAFVFLRSRSRSE